MHFSLQLAMTCFSGRNALNCIRTCVSTMTAFCSYFEDLEREKSDAGKISIHDRPQLMHD